MALDPLAGPERRAAGKWHFAWAGRPVEMRQIGRALGPDIVQTGEDHLGILDRWRFTEIAPRSFRWLGERSWDKGASWTLLLEMEASRAG